MKYYFIPILVLFFLSACKHNNSDGSTNIESITHDETLNLANGFQLLSSNCFACHNPNPKITKQVAPSMAEIKSTYLEQFQHKGPFVEQLVNFLSGPALTKSNMPSAVEQYGLMPKMDFSAADFKNIAGYIYQTPLEKEDWYSDAFQNEKVKYASDEASLNLVKRGLKMAMETKAVLGKNLLNAIQNRGTAEALSFCNTRAIILTDSMSNNLGAQIKRVSDFNRNPENRANLIESKYIRNARILLEAGAKPEPELIENEVSYTAYYPIMTTGLCLQCHGVPEEEIQMEVLEKIINVYPGDKAMGYKEGDLRGIWVVDMKKN